MKWQLYITTINQLAVIDQTSVLIRRTLEDLKSRLLVAIDPKFNKLAAAELTNMSYIESTGGYNKMAAMPAKFNSNYQMFWVVDCVEADDVKIGYVSLHLEHRWLQQNGSYI